MKKKNKLIKKDLPHIHDFKQYGMTLACKCGLIKDIVCAHKWTIEKNHTISFEKMGGTIHQSCQLRTCDVCGAIANLNITAETTQIHH